MAAMADESTSENGEPHPAPGEAAAPVESGDGAPAAPSRYRRLRAVFGAKEAPAVVSAIAALLATGAALFAVYVSSAQAGDQQASFQSAQWCKDYRDEVLALREHGFGPEQIRAWLRTEPGSESDLTAYDDKSTKCHASVCTLLGQAPPPLAAPPDCLGAEAREQHGQ
jgi:hypothetical protein